MSERRDFNGWLAGLHVCMVFLGPGRAGFARMGWMDGSGGWISHHINSFLWVFPSAGGAV